MNQYFLLVALPSVVVPYYSCKSCNDMGSTYHHLHSFGLERGLGLLQ
uniref:Similar to haloacid dehalogenase-like hydrolase family protein n=1 Tax=Arundo donax TaxID=35708 RepID=A0A0A9H8P3_ARUDO